MHVYKGKLHDTQLELFPTQAPECAVAVGSLVSACCARASSRETWDEATPVSQPQTPGTDRADNNQDIMAHLDKLIMTWITACEACKLPSLACIRQVEEKAVRNTSRYIGFICMS